MIKKNDLILIAVILIIGIGALLFMFFNNEAGSNVSVQMNGEEIITFDLNEDITYTIEGDNGAWNTFAIKDGYVDMIDASCPDKICVDHKSIHYNHETITCLPNQVLLEIIGGEENPIDSIAN
ncbi:MAG TPA: NusG domain II-containing protein [Clostridiales bacterium]|nr:NusG domain II-containing protein [Clostridiales bacterium]